MSCYSFEERPLQWVSNLTPNPVTNPEFIETLLATRDELLMDIGDLRVQRLLVSVKMQCLSYLGSCISAGSGVQHREQDRQAVR